MNEHDLDRTIEAATRQLIAREPSRGLTHAVMARVRERASPARQGSLWSAAIVTATVTVCAAIASALMYRSTQRIPSLPVARPLAVAQPPVIAPVPIVVREPHTARRDGDEPVARAVSLPVMFVRPGLSAVTPIEADPIAVAALEVPELGAGAPTSIEKLTVEALTIEPLTASND